MLEERTKKIHERALTLFGMKPALHVRATHRSAADDNEKEPPDGRLTARTTISPIAAVD
jgi:hypothetical protein